MFACLQRGAQLFKDGHPAAAIAPLSEAVSLAPENAVAHYDLGLARLESHRLPGAVASFQQAIALKPDFAGAYYNLAIALERLGRSREAMGAYQKTAELDPKNVAAHSRLAELSIQFGGDHSTAAAWFYRAAAIAPRTPTGRLNRARALISERKEEEAEQELRRLVALAPQLSAAHYALGAILSSSGRFAEAIDSFERAIQADPGNCSAWRSLVLAQKLTEADRPLLARMLARLETSGPRVEGRMQLHFALGKANDDLKDYAEAMRHFDAANALRFSPSNPRRIFRSVSTGSSPPVHPSSSLGMRRSRPRTRHRC